jgi:hypothetical protein
MVHTDFTGAHGALQQPKPQEGKTMAKAKAQATEVSVASTVPMFALTEKGAAIAAKDGQATAHRNLEPQYDHGKWRTEEGGRVNFDNSRAAVLATLGALGAEFSRTDGVAALMRLAAAHPLAIGANRKPAERFGWAIRKGFIKEVGTEE